MTTIGREDQHIGESREVAGRLRARFDESGTDKGHWSCGNLAGSRRGEGCCDPGGRSSAVLRPTPSHTSSAPTVLAAVFLASAQPASAALLVGLEVNPDPAQAGEMLELHALVSNTGGAPSGNLSLDLVYPNDLSQFPVVERRRDLSGWAVHGGRAPHLESRRAGGQRQQGGEHRDVRSRAPPPPARR